MIDAITLSPGETSAVGVMPISELVSGTTLPRLLLIVSPSDCTRSAVLEGIPAFAAVICSLASEAAVVYGTEAPPTLDCV